MGDNDTLNGDNLFNEIDDAVDDLFGQYEKKDEPGPASEQAAQPETDQPPHAEQPSEPAEESPLTLELDEQAPQATSESAAPAEPAEGPSLSLELDEEQLQARQPAETPPKMEDSGLSLDLDLEPAAPETAEPPPQPAAPTSSEPPPVQQQTAPQVDTTLFDKMRETILTIDWEASPPNIQTAISSLSTLRNSVPVSGASEQGLLLEKMSQVLDIMADAPQTAPVSGPKLLNEALDSLKRSAQVNFEPDAAADAAVQNSLSALTNALPHKPDARGYLDLGAQEAPSAPPSPQPEAPAAAEPAQTAPAAPTEHVPSGLSLVLQNYDATLAKSIKNLEPMEKLFGNRTGMSKLHAVVQKTRTQLAGQKKTLGSSFSAGFSQAAIAAGPAGNFADLLQTQSAALSQAIKRLAPLVTLFSRNANYKKLERLTTKIIQSLETENDALIRAAGGDYSPSSVLPKAAGGLSEEYIAELNRNIDELKECLALIKPLANITQVNVDTEQLKQLGDNLQLKLAKQLNSLKKIVPPAKSSISSKKRETGKSVGTCPWTTLVRASWGGQNVAFAPEQIVYISNKQFKRRSFQGQSFLPLKKLKPGMFANLQKLFTGELSTVAKSELKKMELPIAIPPETFPAPEGTEKKITLLILYHDGKGQVFLLDSPTKSINISEHGAWESNEEDGSFIAGTFTVFGNQMPVIAL